MPSIQRENPRERSAAPHRQLPHHRKKLLLPTLTNVPKVRKIDAETAHATIIRTNSDTTASDVIGRPPTRKMAFEFFSDLPPTLRHGWLLRSPQDHCPMISLSSSRMLVFFKLFFSTRPNICTSSTTRNSNDAPSSDFCNHTILLLHLPRSFYTTSPPPLPHLLQKSNEDAEYVLENKDRRKILPLHSDSFVPVVMLPESGRNEMILERALRPCRLLVLLPDVAQLDGARWMHEREH